MQYIADVKRKENIIEYLLYMWQMEDLLRGVKLDLDALEAQVLSSLADDEGRMREKAWFAVMAREMNARGLQTSGHLPETYEVIGELQLLQHTLTTVIRDPKMMKAVQEVTPVLAELRAKGDKVPKSDIEMALTAMYGFLTLKLAGKKISPETQTAVQVIGHYFGLLAAAYRDMKSGKLPLNN